MNVGSIQAFPNPIMYMTLGEQSRQLNRLLLDDIKLEMENTPDIKRSGIEVSQTDVALQAKYNSFSTLKNIIDDIVDNVVAEYFGVSGKSDSRAFWANVNESSHGFHMPHAHSAKELVCGVYFPSSGWKGEDHVSENQNLDNDVQPRSATHPDPGDLVFLDPIHYTKTSTTMGRKVQKFPFFGNPICFTPCEGTLVFFPCWLPHMVTPTTKSDFTRVSIAFGVDFI